MHSRLVDSRFNQVVEVMTVNGAQLEGHLGPVAHVALHV